jgi:MFS family permease
MRLGAESSGSARSPGRGEHAADRPTVPDESRNPFDAPGFARWWLASLVAGTGAGINSVALPLFLRDRVADDARALAIAAALVATTLPGVVLSLIGGAVADRVERHRILAATYTVALTSSLVYVAMAGLDVRAIWPVYPLAVLVGAAAAFTNPARSSMLPLLVTRAQLQNGVILGTTLGFVAAFQLIGPTIGGVLADWRGLTVAFATESLLFGTAALLFSRIRIAAVAPAKGSIRDALREGLAYVRAHAELRGLLALSLVPGIFFIGPFAVTIPLMVPDVFHAPDRWVGILWGCFGGGVVAGSVALTFWTLSRRGLAVCITNLTAGVILLAYGASETLGLSAGILFVWGVGASIFMNYVVALLQERSEPRMIGRVMSMYALAFFIAMPLGYAQAGALTSAFGPQLTLLANGAAAAAIGLANLLALRSVRSLA